MDIYSLVCNFFSISSFHFNSSLRGSKVEIDVFPEHFLEQIIVGGIRQKIALV